MRTATEGSLAGLNGEHERVEIIRDVSSGMIGVISIHSTVLGPALGGMRIRSYRGGLPEALADGLALSRAMTLKASAAGLDLGGGKCVMLDDGRAEFRSERIAALAEEIDRLGGAYITAADIGTTTADMDLVATRTEHVVGRSSNGRDGGDPSPDTARTVLGGMKAALLVLEGTEDLERRRIGVIGTGKVGGRLTEWLLEEGAEVVVFDPAPSTCAVLTEKGACAVDSIEELLRTRLDVLAPCAIGGLIDERMAAGLDARVVCGAANNPTSGRAAAARLAERDILLVPDFMANCGGLIHADAERRRDPDATAVDTALLAARHRVSAVIEEAVSTGCLPDDVAEEHALARIAAHRDAEREA